MQISELEKSLTPQAIVKELDRYIIGQKEAKKAVAIALRNRYRRKLVQGALKEEIVPKNILLIGPTGVGKTEISRRLAKLVGAPFIKVEATKFTEVGYVGRDVDSIIRDLVDVAVNMFKINAKKENMSKAQDNAIERIVTALVGKTAHKETRQSFKEKILSGEMDEKDVEIEVEDNPSGTNNMFDIPGMPGASMGVLNLSDLIGKTLGTKMKLKTFKIKDAIKIITDEEANNLIEEESLNKLAIEAVENNGIVFLDEIDKIASRADVKGGEVSREGVQRDLLPLIEGSAVTTKHGIVKTDHILFIASGAFHLSKPSDLLPELQGRLPIRVELKGLTKEDMISILNDTDASLIKQYVALLSTESVTLNFDTSAIDKIAEIATEINSEVENIGARRLYALIEKILEDISFNATDYKDQEVKIDAQFIEEKLKEMHKKTELAKFIL